jgi:capsular polysaccharide export protein
VRDPSDAPVGGTLLIWGSRAIEGLPLGSRLVRVEDGFLRSRGLGADLIQPLSWVLDDVGIYYDATRPSRLENILQAGGGDSALLARAAALRVAILAAGLSKYNRGGVPWQRPEGGRRVILVPGQVQDDASIKFGTGAVNTNLGLLREVRRMHPDAWIVYKPHPDVAAGLRLAGEDEGRAPEIADEIVIGVDSVAMLTQVDEVHTLTSLLGFEALMRGVPVTCHGRPFYSGWSLTRDMLPNSRRTRKLTLDALVAGTLIAYPRYVNLSTGRFTTPERTACELAGRTGETPSAAPRWRRIAAQTLARLRRVCGPKKRN